MSAQLPCTETIRHLQSYCYINGIVPSSPETALQVSTIFLVLLCSPPRHLEPEIWIHNIVIININKIDDDISYSIKSAATQELIWVCALGETKNLPDPLC